MILVLSMLIFGLISTIGYILDRSGRFRISALCYMFYGSMLMWSVDLYTELKEDGLEALAMNPGDVIDDLLLSASVTVLALAVWGVINALHAFRKPARITEAA